MATVVTRASVALINLDHLGADIANMVNLAATEAIKKDEGELTTSRLRDAIITISLGRVRTSVHLGPETVRNTAVHESGHAIVALFTEEAEGVSQMTVLPRGHSLGSTSFKLEEDKEYSQTRDQLLAGIDVGESL